MLQIQNNINMLGDLKNDAFDHYHHTYPASYLWVSDGKSESHSNPVITVQQRSSNKEVEIARLHQEIRFYISFAFVNTIG